MKEVFYMVKIEEFWDKIERKLSNTAPQVGAGFPYTTDENGKYVEWKNNGKISVSWWTNGFWAGMMWLAYLETGKEIYKEIAEKSEEMLDEAFDDFNGLHHDVGFMWLLSAVADYRLTKNERSKTRGLHAATLLAGRFNIDARYIRAWNGDLSGWAIIDCMMNIPLLYWATEVTGDPRFEMIAKAHADTVLKAFIRADGSVNHIVSFDPLSGEVLETPAGQGFASGSSWSRGQAWAIYGFVISYIHTGKTEYLSAAKRVAHYFISNIGDDGVPLVDFRAPKEPVLKDTTAGAIAACGLIEIAAQVEEYEKDMYMKAAMKLLGGLYDNCDFSAENQSILQNGTERYHDTRGFHIPIIYGDYFMMEALMKLKGNKNLFW